MALPYNNRPRLVTRIIYVSHKNNPRDSVIKSHFHPTLAHELIYVDYGKVNLAIENQKFTINSGEAVLIDGFHYHTFAGMDGLPFDFLNIMFYGEIPEVLFHKKFTISRECHDLLVKLREESIDEIEFQGELCSCYLTELLVTLWRQETMAAPKTRQQAAYHQNYHSEVVRRAMTLIAENYMRPLTLDQIAKATGVSVPYLRILLKRETGQSFMAILHEQRIAAAKHLLSRGTLPLSGIAEAVGYSSLSAFFHLFRRQTGMSPKVYAESLGDPQEKVMQ